MKTTLLILVIGDSIAHGWGPHVTSHIPPENCRGTRQVLERMHLWDEDRHWPVIIFNCGLHDIAQGVSPEEYARNVRWIVWALRPRCDHLFFCTTTPGRDGAWHNRPEVVERFNKIALEVMREEDVPVIDLYGAAVAHREWWKQDIHYTEDGYKGMAEYVKHALTPSGISRRTP